MNDIEFRKFLHVAYRSSKGEPISSKAIADTVSRCRRVERVFHVDLDDLAKLGDMKGVLGLLDAVQHQASVSANVVRDCRSAIRRYLQFRHTSS